MTKMMNTTRTPSQRKGPETNALETIDTGWSCPFSERLMLTAGMIPRKRGMPSLYSHHVVSYPVSWRRSCVLCVGKKEDAIII